MGIKNNSVWWTNLVDFILMLLVLLRNIAKLLTNAWDKQTLKPTNFNILQTLSLFSSLFHACIFQRIHFIILMCKKETLSNLIKNWSAIFLSNEWNKLRKEKNMVYTHIIIYVNSFANNVVIRMSINVEFAIGTTTWLQRPASSDNI